MITIRKNHDRGKSNREWLSSAHTFSFGDYYDANYMGFSSLRVINEDIVAPTKGFGSHPHENMEILTYVIDGVLAHKDTLNNNSEIKKGEIQLMSAGSGIEHSEFNPSPHENVHFLQIWIRPSEKKLKPGYQQKSFQDHLQGLKLVVSPDGNNGSLKIHQDAKIYLGRFEQSQEITFPAWNRHIWIQMIKGSITVDDLTMIPGDGMSISNENAIVIQSKANCEFLLFDLL